MTKQCKELCLDNLPPELKGQLEKYMVDKKSDDDDEREDRQIMPIPIMMMSSGGLEDRGIIILNDVINKQSLAEPTSKILSLNFDESFTDSIQLVINSPGGALDASFAFIDMLGSLRLPVRTIAMGEICSAATMIFVTGDERVMSPNSMAMVHHFSMGVEGPYPALLENRKLQDLFYGKMLNHFLRNSKYTKQADVLKYILKDHDNWLTPEEMKKHGLCDIIMPHKERKKEKSKGKKSKK